MKAQTKLVPSSLPQPLRYLKTVLSPSLLQANDSALGGFPGPGASVLSSCLLPEPAPMGSGGTANRNLLGHIFPRAGLLAMQLMKRASEQRWVHTVPKWAFKDVFQPWLSRALWALSPAELQVQLQKKTLAGRNHCPGSLLLRWPLPRKIAAVKHTKAVRAGGEIATRVFSA